MIFQCNALRNQVIDLTFLKRQYTLHDDGRLTIQTREKHITQLCSLLGLKVRNQNKKNPAHADIEKEDDTAELSSSSATTFRTCVGVLMYLANDVPQTQHVIRHLATYSSKPTEKSLTVFGHFFSDIWWDIFAATWTFAYL